MRYELVKVCVGSASKPRLSAGDSSLVTVAGPSWTTQLRPTGSPTPYTLIWTVPTAAPARHCRDAALGMQDDKSHDNNPHQGKSVANSATSTRTSWRLRSCSGGARPWLSASQLKPAGTLGRLRLARAEAAVSPSSTAAPAEGTAPCTTAALEVRVRVRKRGTKGQSS